MTQGTRYPSPGQGDSSHPFYNQPSRRAPPTETEEQMELSEQFSRDMHTGPHGNVDVNANANVNVKPNMVRAEHRQPAPTQTFGGYGEHAFAQQAQNYSHMMAAQMAQQEPTMTPNAGHADPAAGLQDSAVKVKKSKVSRACDECRRKKIRCEFPGSPDGQAQHPNDTCSNCVRTAASCKFSQVPQKRGPSKGYIRELADRLQNVEQAIGGPALGPTQPSPQGLQDYTGNPNIDPNRDPRKRNHSTSEGLSPADYNQNQAQLAQDRYPPPPGWNAQTNALYAPAYAGPTYHPQAAPSGYTDMNYNAPAPHAVMSSSGTTPAVGPPQMAEQGISTDDTQMTGTNELADVNFSWKDNFIDEYYRTIHPTLPVIVDDKQLLRGFLSSVSAPIREAFLQALYSAVSAATPNPALRDQEGYGKTTVQDLLKDVISSNASSRGYASNLVYLQTALLMVISIDMSGPSSQATLPKSVWLRLASSTAQYLKLPTELILENGARNTANPNSIDLVSRRTWWSLVVLDRWHSASTGEVPQIQEYLAVMESTDTVVLGSSFYFLARISLALGRLSELAYASPIVFKNHTVVTVILGEIETLRGSIEIAHLSNPIASMACTHVEILVERHNPNTTSDFKQILATAKALTNMVLKNGGLITPLAHHFVGLSAATLINLMDVKESKAGAQQGLLDLQKAMQQNQNPSLAFLQNGVQQGNRTWVMAIADKINKKLHHPVQPTQPDTDTTTTDPGGLQGLAEVAAVRHGEESTGSDATAVDWHKLDRAGYLTFFS